jgi:hypothetical protein
LEEGELPEETAFSDDEAPKTTERQDGDKVKDTAEYTDSSNLLLLQDRKEQKGNIKGN